MHQFLFVIKVSFLLNEQVDAVLWILNISLDNEMIMVFELVVGNQSMMLRHLS